MKKLLFLMFSFLATTLLHGDLSEFNCMLKPSSLGGVGVFAAQNIPADSKVFTELCKFRTVKIKEIPTEFIKYCIFVSDNECLCPERFDCMELGWYINHSDNPNITRRAVSDTNELSQSYLFTLRAITAGEEILIDYNCLDEPENMKEDYYKK